MSTSDCIYCKEIRECNRAKTCCYDVEGYFCTREPEHEGDHIACGLTKHEIIRCEQKLRQNNATNI